MALLAMPFGRRGTVTGTVRNKDGRQAPGTNQGETDAGDNSKAICRVSKGLQSPEEDARCRRVQKQKRWRLFGVGLAVRLIGVALLWLGDGHDHWFRKGLVVVGLVLSVGGIGILRYLLISGFRKKR